MGENLGVLLDDVECLLSPVPVAAEHHLLELLAVDGGSVAEVVEGECLRPADEVLFEDIEPVH